MTPRNRKARLAIALAAAVLVAFAAWRNETRSRRQDDCVPSRIEEKDANGKVTRINSVVCAKR